MKMFIFHNLKREEKTDKGYYILLKKNLKSKMFYKVGLTCFSFSFFFTEKNELFLFSSTKLTLLHGKIVARNISMLYPFVLVPS